MVAWIFSLSQANIRDWQVGTLVPVPSTGEGESYHK